MSGHMVLITFEFQIQDRLMQKLHTDKNIQYQNEELTHACFLLHVYNYESYRIWNLN